MFSTCFLYQLKGVFKIITRKRLFQDLLFWWELIEIYFEIESKQTQICSLEQLNCFLNSLSWFYFLAIFITRWFDPSWRLMILRKCLGDFVFLLTSFNWRSNSLSSSFKVLHNSFLNVRKFDFFQPFLCRTSPYVSTKIIRKTTVCAILCFYWLLFFLIMLQYTRYRRCKKGAQKAAVIFLSNFYLSLVGGLLQPTMTKLQFG